MRRLFPSQEDDEKIYIVLREHWVRLALKCFIWLIFPIFLVAFERYAPDFFSQGTAGQITSLFTKVYVLFLILSLMVIWLIWYLNVQVITDRRIVDINQEGLFSHTVSELHINNIEDVTSEINGPFGMVFQYGNVYVQTAGTVDRFVFYNVPNPGSIEKMLLDLYEQLPNRGPLHSKP